MSQEHDSTIEDHDRGLSFDLPKLISRRRAVTLLAGGVGSLALGACGSSGNGAASSGTTTTSGVRASTTPTAGATGEIADETAGPYPGDGSNGPNVLAESGVVRSDITRSIGDASGVAGGVADDDRDDAARRRRRRQAAGGRSRVPVALRQRGPLLDVRPGRADENYLRGVQASDRDGKVSFKSIFPAAYPGRWPHIHFEVYESVDAATSSGSKLKTSQIALPAKTCELVYATDGYEQSVQTVSQTSLDTDMVFSDGYAGQLATASGDVRGGITLALNVGV